MTPAAYFPRLAPVSQVHTVSRPIGFIGGRVSPLPWIEVMPAAHESGARKTHREAGVPWKAHREARTNQL